MLRATVSTRTAPQAASSKCGGSSGWTNRAHREVLASSSAKGRSCYIPALPLALIHPGAWKENSANIAYIRFSDVRMYGVLGGCLEDTESGPFNAASSPPALRGRAQRPWLRPSGLVAIY